MTLAELKTLIDTYYPDNTTGLINPAGERIVLKALADFMVSSQGESDTAPFVYDPAFSYAAGAPVIYDSAWFLSLAGANLNNQPDTSPLSWEPVNAFNTVLSIWELNAVYLGELSIVIKDDKLYLLDRDVVGTDPFVSTNFATELAAAKWISLLPNSKPVANTYANNAAMFAAQGSQVSGYFYIAGASLFIYLGTTTGDITDYFPVGSGGGGGGISSVSATSGLEVDLTDPANPIIKITPAKLAEIANGVTAFGWGNHASAGYLTGYQPAIIRENNTVLFDKDYITGNAGVRSGNIDFDFTGAQLGATTTMDHQDASAFIYDTTATLRFLAGTYDDTQLNVFYFQLRKLGASEADHVIDVTISQVQP